MGCMGAYLRGMCAGAAGVIALTSFSSALFSLRFAVPAQPYAWIENPFPAGVVGSIAWHLVLAMVFTLTLLLIWRPEPVRRLQTGLMVVAASLALISLGDSAVYYSLVARGHIESDFPMPMSLIVAALIATSILLLSKRSCDLKRSAWVVIAIGIVGALAGSAAMTLVHLLTFGSTDYTRPADVAIVLGARVYADGTPSPSLMDRLQTGVDLYGAGHVRYLLMTGGTGVEGLNEAQVMRDYALAAGIPDERILVDERGVNTHASARNCRPILDAQGFSSALIVSHYYHLARCKLAFAEQGIPCATVPARMSMHLVKEPYFVMRECVAYIVYAVERAFRPDIGPVRSAEETTGWGSKTWDLPDAHDRLSIMGQT